MGTICVEREAIGACWPKSDPLQWRHFDALLGLIETAAAHHVHAGHLSERPQHAGEQCVTVGGGDLLAIRS